MDIGVLEPLVHPDPERAFQLAVDWASKHAKERAMEHRQNQSVEMRERMGGWKEEDLVAKMMCFQFLPRDD